MRFKILIVAIIIGLFILHTTQFILSFYNDKSFKVYIYISSIMCYLYALYLIVTYKDNNNNNNNNNNNIA